MSNVIVVVGDTHGNIQNVNDCVRHAKKGGNDVIGVIHVGDFGLYDFPNWNKYKQGKSKFDVMTLVTIGNHEDPFEVRKLMGDENVVNNFYLFRHIDVKEFFGLNIMSVGGAMSVDKMGERTHVPHDNSVYHDAITEWFKMGKPHVDIIVTHEAPNKSGLHSNPVIAEKYGVTSELGSQELRDLITEVGPKIQVNGHHHTWNNCRIGKTDCWTLPIPFCSSPFWNSFSLSGYGLIDAEALRFIPIHMIDGVDY